MKILFTGDFCPFDEWSVDYFKSVKDIFNGADYAFVNLECPLTESTKKIEKCGPNLKASPNQIAVVKALGVNCVTLANNHMLDYDGRGVFDTLKICDAHNIKHVGAGANIKSAQEPLLLEKADEKVAVINVAEKEFCIATESSPGAAPFDIIDLMRQLDVARSLADDIVVVIHGGLEHVSYPSPESVRVLRFLAEQKNVRAIIRHHPHVIQGMEIWKGVPIFYSLGNFYFPMKNAPTQNWYHGLMAELDIFAGNVTVNYRGVKTGVGENGAFKVLLDPDIKLPELDERTLANVWRDEFSRRQEIYFNAVFTPSLFIEKVFSKLGIFRRFPPTSAKRRLVENLIRCDAHREVVQNIMKGENK